MAEEDTAPGFTELQQALLGSHSIEQFLQELAELAARLVTDGLCCGMTLRSAGGPVTAACTDQVASLTDTSAIAWHHRLCMPGVLAARSPALLRPRAPALLRPRALAS